jgi:hypothetical protein
MPKDAEFAPGPPPAESERPIGELFSELIDEGKAYGRAELGVLKAVAAAKGKALILPAALYGVAFILVLAGNTALALGIVLALAKFVGPFAAGLVGLAVFGGLAGASGWYATRLLGRVL